MRWKELGHIDRIVITAVILTVCTTCLEKRRNALLHHSLLLRWGQLREKPASENAHCPTPEVCHIPGKPWSGPQSRITQRHIHCSGSLITVAVWLFRSQRVVYDPRLGAPTTWRGFLRSFPILRQEGGCSGHSGLPFFSLRGGMAIKAARRRWMTYPCSLSGRAGVRLQGSPVPSLGLFSRRQTGSSRTPRALWLELVWIPGL